MIVDGAALPAKLRGLASRDRDTELVIWADDSVPYGRIALVLDRARRAGLARVSFTTAPPAP